MAIGISEVFLFIVTFFKSIFGFITNLLLQISADFSEVIVLALAGIAGYFLIKAYDNGKIKRWVFYAIIILILWLMLRFSIWGGT